MPSFTGFEEFMRQGNKIRQKKIIATVIAIVSAFLLVLFGIPARIEIMGKPFLVREGLSFWEWIISFFILLVAYALSCFIIDLKQMNAMSVECEPRKNFGLEYYSTNGNVNEYTALISFFFMGRFDVALYYADKLICKNQLLYDALFYKASCLFFLGKSDEFRCVVLDMEARLLSDRKKRAKHRRSLIYLYLMLAICENDLSKIALYRNKIEISEKNLPSEVFLNCLKGVAAFFLKEKNEAIYRLMAAKDKGANTFFASYADVYLEKLN